MITFSQLGKFGRFGNQLWQIASTIGIAIKNNQDFGFSEWEYQKYFEHSLPLYNQKKPTRRVPELSSGYVDTTLKDFVDHDLQGYFQSYKYFEHCKDLIEYFFEPIIETNDHGLDQIAIHVRRTDYLSLGHIHPNLTMDYYNKAMKLFPGKEFKIFSDDIEWCKQNFDNDTCTFVIENPQNDPVLDFFYMSKHAGFIIANSSFSWWAAWLAKDKPVVSPNVWAYNEPRETIEDRIPPGWERISI
jgi:hypothetical protein